MGAAFGIVNIVAETKNIFVKFINILEGGFNFNTFRFAFKINDIADTFISFVHIFDKSDNAIRFMKFQMLRCAFTKIVINNSKIRI